MKKPILFVLLLVLGLTLSACKKQDDPVCDTGEILVDGECVEEDTYDDRSLVTEECQTLENIGDWQPVWCEEFNYTGLPDKDRWFYDTGGSGFGNNELQYYTSADPDNVYVENGNLTITALREDYIDKEYTSARLVSKYRGDFLYGKIDVRAIVPAGRGTWAAIWMLPTDYAYGGWPHSGEIDIMEYVGYDPNVIHGTIHTGEYNHKNGNQIGFSKILPDVEEEFHVYSLEWEPGRMEVFVNDESYGVFGYNPLFNIGVENSEAWPFDQVFHLILNIAIGGDWGGVQGVDDSIFPTEMVIDYVRVYQKDYAGMDKEAPGAVQNLSLLDSSASSLQFMWSKATDDVMVKEYEILVDGEVHATTTVNGYLMTGLDPDTTYNIEVVAVDFAGNRGEGATVSLSTAAVRDITGRIEAESYDSQSGVVRETTDDVEGDQHVAWIDTDDYMLYTLYVPTAGTYRITYRLWSNNPGEIKLYGKTVVPLNTTTFESTGETWIDVTNGTFTLQEGLYTFRVRATDGGFRLNYFEFELIEE
jgi:beta-glucanase (GH16 family)